MLREGLCVLRESYVVDKRIGAAFAWLDSLPVAPEPTLEFWGWWDENDKLDSPEPYEHWRVILFGDDAGDQAYEPDQIAQVLACSGYELILRRRPEVEP